MPDLYTPQRHGFGQSAYFDQMPTALAGVLAFAADSNLVDSFIAGAVGDGGLEAGLAVTAVPATDAARPGINGRAVVLPSAGTAADQIAGVVVRTQQMATNARGCACVFAEGMCSVARPGRSGARIWVRLAEGARPVSDGPVFVVVDGPDAGKFAASGGVAMDNMKFRSGAEDGIALIEMM